MKDNDKWEPLFLIGALMWIGLAMGLGILIVSWGIVELYRNLC